MAKTVREVMTPSPMSLPATASLIEAARTMRDKDVGAVLVTKDGTELCGIVTDRDIVIRALAAGHDPEKTTLSTICSQELAELSPDASVHEAVNLMRDKAIRRIPVTEHGKPVGILSIGDLAVEEDPGSALGEISAKPPNR